MLSAEKILQASITPESFVVFDLETTGGNPEKNGITEFFAAKLSSEDAAETFHSLVNPKISIPPIVRRMTGITNAMVRDAPTIDQIMPDFLQFLDQRVIVSHNAQGDLKFLQHYCRKVTGKPFEHFYVCTHILAEKLFPDAPSKSLKGLAKYFGLESGRLHRAEADVSITRALFEKELAELQSRGIRTVEELIRFQGDAQSLSRLGWKVDAKKIRSLPNSPGVFTLFDKERKVLMIAATSNLQRDLSRYPSHDQLPKPIVKLALRSHDLDSERSFTLFEALNRELELLESHPHVSAASSLFQRQVQGIICQEIGHHCLIKLSPIEKGTAWAFGPIANHKEAHLLLKDLAKIAGAELGREGFRVSQEQGEILHHAFLGKRHAHQKSWLDRLAFWKGNSQEKLFHHWRERLASQNWISLMDYNGIVIVPADGSGRSLIYRIDNSCPTFAFQWRGDRVEDFPPEKLKAFHKHIRRESVSLETARRINAFLWWHLLSPQRREGRFLTLEAMRTIIKE